MSFSLNIKQVKIVIILVTFLKYCLNLFMHLIICARAGVNNFRPSIVNERLKTISIKNHIDSTKLQSNNFFAIKVVTRFSPLIYR